MKIQDLLNNLGIKHKKTPPHTPQYNGVAKRALGILRDKTVALLRSFGRSGAELFQRENNSLVGSGRPSIELTTNPYSAQDSSSRGK